MEPSNGDPAAREAPYRSSLQPRFARAFTSPAERPHAAAAPPDDDCATLARPAPLWERVAEMFAAPPNRARAGAPSMTSDWERVLPLRQTITPYAAPGPAGRRSACCTTAYRSDTGLPADAACSRTSKSGCPATSSTCA